MEGIITVLKPPGMTSSNAVSDVRKLTGEKHVGHLGTLDPGAAGVLPVCLGRAARLFDYLVDKQKTYIAEIRFGASTDTQDCYGTVLESSNASVTAEALKNVLPAFTGDILQTAPAYSALKVDGRKMYDLAREGTAVPERVRPVTVYALDYVRQTGEDRFLLKVTCSRGTYIRTLCHDIGTALGVPAHMSFLLRSASGPFTLEKAYSLPELTDMRDNGTLETALISCETALMGYPALKLPADRLIPSKNGLPTGIRKADGVYRLYANDIFLGLATVKDKEARLTVHLYD